MSPGPRSTTTTEPLQTVESIAGVIEAFLAEHPRAVVLEDGKVVFDMREAKYRLAAEHGRCTLHLWSEERNLVRRVGAAVERKGVLRLSTHRFGQTKPQTLELVADRDRRTPSARETARVRYLRVLERVLARQFPEWKVDGLRAAMDLEKSFGPAYARGSLVKAQHAWAVIAVNDEESPAIVDGILTLGILWLDHCRAAGDGRRLYQGLKVIVPRGMGAVTASRMAWLNVRAARWELWELHQASEELEQREPGDHGNLTTRLVNAPNEVAARERFAGAIARVMALVPEMMRGVVEQRVRSGAEVGFLLHGLEFARVRSGYAGSSFNREDEITFGAGANETLLTEDNEDALRELVERLFERRHAAGDKRDPLYRMQPERWLESVLRRDVGPLDERLSTAHVYTQVPAFAAGDRGMLDLLGVTDDGRLAVIELKADEDLHLVLQGLDYWVRVRWHHRQNAATAERQSFGLGEFQRLGYFGGMRLSEADPRLYLVAPALRAHPANEVVLKYLSPQVEWTLVALDERWREKVKAVWRKRSGSMAP